MKTLPPPPPTTVVALQVPVVSASGYKLQYLSLGSTSGYATFAVGVDQLGEKSEGTTIHFTASRLFLHRKGYILWEYDIREWKNSIF